MHAHIISTMRAHFAQWVPSVLQCGTRGAHPALHAPKLTVFSLSVSQPPLPFHPPFHHGAPAPPPPPNPPKPPPATLISLLNRVSWTFAGLGLQLTAIDGKKCTRGPIARPLFLQVLSKISSKIDVFFLRT